MRNASRARSAIRLAARLGKSVQDASEDPLFPERFVEATPDLDGHAFGDPFDVSRAQVTDWESASAWPESGKSGQKGAVRQSDA